MRDFWNTLCGSIFLPFCTQPEIKKKFVKYLTETQKSLPVKSRAQFGIFKAYLVKYFFSANSLFPIKYFDYNDMIVEQNDFDISTNSLECINRNLKSAAGSGSLPLHPALTVVCEFAKREQNKFAFRMGQGRFNRQNKKTVLRHERMTKQIVDFTELPLKHQLTDCLTFANQLHRTNRTANPKTITSIEAATYND